MTPLPLRRPHHRMYLAAFLLDFSVATGLTAVPFLIVRRLEGSAALLGAVGAVQMGLYAGGCLLSSGALRHAGRSIRTATFGVGLFAVVFLVTPFLNHSSASAVAACIPFLGLALAWPAMQSWLSREPDTATRARHIAGFNTATAFGFMFSPLVAGPLYDFDYRGPFLLLFGLCGAVIALLTSLPGGEGSGTSRSAEEMHADSHPPFSPNPGLLYASWAALFTGNALFSVLRSLYPMRLNELVETHHLVLFDDWTFTLLGQVGPATLFSWLSFLLSFFTVICFAVMGRTRAWQGRFSLVALVQIVAAGAILLLSRTHSLVVMLFCFAMVGTAFGLCFFAALFYSLAEAAMGHRRAAINEGMLGAGGFAGALSLGHIAGQVGLASALGWLSIAVVAAVLIQWVLLHRFQD